MTTNTVEGYFSIFKRGMRGVYQHCGEKHLHRYCAEFAFRYTFRTATGFDDRQRAIESLKGIVGKRLTYRRLDSAPDPKRPEGSARQRSRWVAKLHLRLGRFAFANVIGYKDAQRRAAG